MIQLKNAVAEDDKNAEARYELGKLYFTQLDLASAEKEFRRAREAGLPASTVNPMIARALLGQREYQRVLDELPAPADSDPDAATLQALRATAALGLGQTEEARKTLQHALQSAPDNVDVHLALAQLALADGDADKAMQDLEQALRIDPRHLDSLLLKGDLLRATGKPAEAAAIYREVLKIDPRQINARLALAGIAIADNKLDDARAEVDAALKAMPQQPASPLHPGTDQFPGKENRTCTRPSGSRAEDRPGILARAVAGRLDRIRTRQPANRRDASQQSGQGRAEQSERVAPAGRHPAALGASRTMLQRTLAPALKSANPDAGVLVVAGEIALAKKDFSQASTCLSKPPSSTRTAPPSAPSSAFPGSPRATAVPWPTCRPPLEWKAPATAPTPSSFSTSSKNKQFDAALTSIAALEKKQAASPLTWNYRGAAYLGKQDIAARTRQLQPGAQARSRLFSRCGQSGATRSEGQAARRCAPALRGHPQGRPQASQRHARAGRPGLRNKDEKAYVSWLEKAATAHPQALQPRVALARYQLAKGDKNKALATAREAVNAQPDNPAALDLLGTTQLALGDTTNALGSYRKLVERQPGQAAPLVKLATAQIVSQRPRRRTQDPAGRPAHPAGFPRCATDAGRRRDPRLTF